MHALCVTWLNGHRLERILTKSLTSLAFFSHETCREVAKLFSGVGQQHVET